jgi:hypothetical protein
MMDTTEPIDQAAPRSKDFGYETADYMYRLSTMPQYYNRKAIPEPDSGDDNITEFAMGQNALPLVTRDDTANTVTGMTTAMEFSLNGVDYVPYDPILFNTIDMTKNIVISVRTSGTANCVCSDAVTLVFTA